MSSLSSNFPTQPGATGDVTGLAATAPLNVTDSGGPVPTVFIDTATASANDYLKYNGTSVVWAAIPAGGVAAVTASAPLASSGGGSPNISLTGIVPQANGGLGVDASALSNGVLVKSGGVMSSTTAPTMSGANISANTIPAASVAPGTVSDTEFGYLDGATSNIQAQLNTLAADVALATAGGNTFYLQEVASDIVGYETLRTQPSTAAEDWDEKTVSSATSPILIDPYATETGVPGIAQWPAGNWIFHVHGTVDSNTGDTRLVANVYSRTTGGTETLLFTSTSAEMTTAVTEYQWTTVQPSFELSAQTDRLVIKFYTTTTSVATRTVRIYYQGSAQTSHVVTPIPSPLPISGPANEVLATPNGSAGITGLRKLVGADLTDATIANTKITGATLGRVLADNGTNAQWVPAGTLNYLFFSNGGSSLPAWTNTLVGINIDGSTNTVYNLTTASLATGFNLAATQGGTGQTSYTVGDVLYASTTTALSKLAAGTSGYVLTAAGAGVAPAWAAPITNTTGSASLSGTYNVTTSYGNVGLPVSLPSAGKYRVWGEVRCQLQVSSSTGNITIRLYNSTAASAITDSERISDFSASSVLTGSTVPISEYITVAGATTIDVQAIVPAGPTYTSAQILSDTSGRSRLHYEKVGP